MLGCHCLRQKVVLLKPKQEEMSEGSLDSPLSQTLTEDEEGSIKVKRKKKKKKKSVAYGKLSHVSQIRVVLMLSIWFK